MKRRSARLVVLSLVLLAGCTVPRRPAAPPRRTSERAIGAASQGRTATPPEHITEAEESLPHAAGLYFRTETFHEDALAGHHEHMLVELLDIPLLVIRDEDVFKSTADRAEAIARVLREALHAGDRFFIIGNEGELPAIYSVSHHGGYPRLVLRISRGDTVAYSRRSGREVDQRLLAQWWLAVLKDVLAVVFFNEPPKSTSSVPAAESLLVLREQLWGAGQSEPMSPERLAAAEVALSVKTRQALRSLAFRVPAEFSGPPRDATKGEDR